VPPPPPLLFAPITNWMPVGALLPPGPVAVNVVVLVSAMVGVPEINPVAALIERPVGRPSAVQAVAGRVAALVKAGVTLIGVPKVPLNDWPAVITGARMAAAMTN